LSYDGSVLKQALLLSCALALSAADLYVSPKGSDQNPGTLAKPFLSLDAARDAARALPRTAPITIWLGAGTYTRSASLSLGAADSGVTWRAAEGAQVRIVGGRPVSGFKKWRGSILRADIKKQAVTDYGTLKSRGFHRFNVAALELFFNGRPMTLARWPNVGWAHLADATVEKSKDQFAYAGDRPARWAKAPDAWVHGYWMWDWAESYDRIESIDTAAHVIHTAEPRGVYGYRAGQRWQALNLLEELDEPGEWFLDRKAGQLYFWPPAPLKGAEVMVSMLEQPLVAMEGASHIELRDIEFAYTRADAVVIHGGEGNRLAHCTLANIGNRGVVIEGGRGHGVADSEIRDTGEGGILLTGGDRKTLTPSGHFAERNHIHDFSRWVRTYTPAVMMTGVGSRVVGNTIHNAPHTAILLNGNDHLIEHNDIHTVAMETGDVGGFYLGRDWTERGNTVRSNYFHNLGHGDVNAVYLDDCASGTIVQGNVIHRAHRGVMIGGGHDNRIEGNKFIDCDMGIHFDARGLGWAAFWFSGKDSTLFDRLKAMPFESEPWRSRYPQLLTIAQRNPAKAQGNAAIGNQVWGASWIRYYNDLKESDMEQRDNVIVKEPVPVDPAWVRGMGLDIVTPVLESRLSADKLTVENLGREPVSGIFDVWVDSAAPAKLLTPSVLEFSLKAGERREFPMKVEHTGKTWLGVELRGQGLVPAGVKLP
jgi:hypothetical protein